MKKNLFLLFSIYFFILQPLIIGILRGQGNFFWLGAINLVAIILIGILYNTVEGTPEIEKVTEKKTIHEPKISFHDHVCSPLKDRKKKKELALPAIISFVAAIIIFFIFQYNTASPEIILVFALSLGFIIFISLTFIFKHRITKSFWALFGTKIYIVLLVISIALTAYDYYHIHEDYQASFQDYIAQNLLGQDVIPTDEYIFTGKGEILGTGLGSTGGEVSSDILSDVIVQEETGTVLDVSTHTEEKKDTAPAVLPTTLGNQTLMDAVIYLLKKYEIPLITKKDIKFTYVSFSNQYYPERRTAYANKMIGKTTNPSKYIVCESYIVMKGLLEKRPVTYTSSTVLDKFRAEAVKRDALNGCVKGKIVTDKTL